ncbi:phosphonoacetaldehyde hydrolase [Paenibacillus sp. MBLB4367]|uniref:phosphonoacetaldehyde hydrolase n=1 Tax=Paenibacillus sp. MBLB4367 TaxID=3384767 RepID=UPI0039081A29
MIKAVMADWAGTMVDYGCFAPMRVFVEVFRQKGVAITDAEARGPMGLLKRDHIRAICRMERVAEAWREKYGKLPDENDVDELYAAFEPMLLSILHDYAEPIPGAVELAARLRDRGIRIGSTTGYTAEMMAIVAPEAEKRGYAPDMLVTPEEVPAGRPYPWMIYRNAIALGVYPMAHIAKVGDTISDMQEGVNAGLWTIGVVLGSSELGMSEEEVCDCDPAELEKRVREVGDRFRAAGAHYVIERIGQLDLALDEINRRLAAGERP